MKLNLTITLTEHEARRLWAYVTEEETDPPLGQDLADWAAEYAMTTLESNWQYDARVFASVSANGVSDTVDLLKAIKTETDSDHQAELVESLCAGHDLADNADALAVLLAEYAQLLQEPQPKAAP
jgi:hypothetical protein